MITIQNVTKNFGHVAVLKPLDFSLEPHTITALIGPNGSGKTTLLSILAQIIQPTNGHIQIENEAIQAKHIGFLPQYPKFYPWMNGEEFLQFVGGLHHMPKKQLRAKIDDVLQFVGLAEAGKKKIATYSGGMKQRLGIAQAILHEPKLLLLDEPVSALDPMGRRDMFQLFEQLKHKMTILYSTHILNDAEQLTDQLLFLKDGQLVEQNTLEQIRGRYREEQFAITFSTPAAANNYAASFEGEAVGNTLFISKENGHTMASLMRYFADVDDMVEKIETRSTSLEEIFMKVMR